MFMANTTQNTTTEISRAALQKATIGRVTITTLQKAINTESETILIRHLDINTPGFATRIRHAARSTFR